MPTPGYTRAGTWRGHPKWNCDSCAFSAVNETEIAQHAAGHRPAPRPSGLLGANGKPLLTEPAPPPAEEQLTEPAPPTGGDGLTEAPEPDTVEETDDE